MSGAPLARFWLHNGFLDIAQEKMSKSLGNVLLVRDLLPTADGDLRRAWGETIRYALLGAHYRKPLNWSATTLDRARQALVRFYLTLRDLPGPRGAPAAAMPSGVLAALEDDLNTPQALAKLRTLARAANASADPDRRSALKSQLLAGGQLLGLLQLDPETYLQSIGAAAGTATVPGVGATEAAARGRTAAGAPVVEVGRPEIERLVEQRMAARRAKDFAEADRIRERLAAAGVILEDGPDGTRWRRAG